MAQYFSEAIAILDSYSLILGRGERTYLSDLLISSDGCKCQVISMDDIKIYE